MPVRTALLVILLCLTGSAWGARSNSAPAELVKADPIGFAEQRTAVEGEMKDGGRFAEISDEDRAAVAQAFDRMQAVLAGKQSMDDLRQDDRVALINDQELVNALLTKAKIDSRMVCKRERRVGSHRLTSTCRTAAEWKRASEQSREDIERRRSMGDILPQGE
jgi:hypothetical protein